MAVFVIKNQELYLNGFELTSELTTVTISWGAEMLDKTVLGDASRGRVAGLTDLSADLQGFWDGARTATSSGDAGAHTDKEIFDTLGSSGGQVLSFGPINSSEGELGYTMKPKTATYNPGASVGEILAYTMSMQGDGPLVRGTIISKGSKTTTSSGGASYNLGAIAAPSILHGALHVTSVGDTSTGSTLDILIQSGTGSGFTAPVTRMTFTQVSANVTGEFLTATGGVTDTWWRALFNLTSTGAPVYTVFLVLGIQKP